MKYIIASLGLTCYAWFAIGIRYVFVTKGKPTSGINAIKLGATLSAIVEIYCILHDGIYSISSGLSGSVLYIFCLFLFGYLIRLTRRQKLSLAFCKDSPEFMYQTGPYRYVRHPFYTCYILSYIAGLVATLNPILLAVVAFMFIIYTMAARMEEQKFAHSELAQDYADYKARTWRFFPKPSFLSPDRARSA